MLTGTGEKKMIHDNVDTITIPPFNIKIIFPFCKL